MQKLNSSGFVSNPLQKPVYINPDDLISVGLMKRAQQDDMEAFNELVGLWKDAIFNFLCKIGPSYADAQDLTQTTFFKLWQARARYQPMGLFKSYLFQIAANEVRQLYRSRKSRPQTVDIDSVVPTQDTTTGDAVRRHQEAFDLILKDLSPTERSILVLYAQEGMSYQDISKTLSLTLPQVKFHLHQARQKVKNKAHEFFE